MYSEEKVDDHFTPIPPDQGIPYASSKNSLLLSDSLNRHFAGVRRLRGHAMGRWGEGLARGQVHRRQHRSANLDEHHPVPVLPRARLLLLLRRLLQLCQLLPPLRVPVDLALLVQLDRLVRPEQGRYMRRKVRIESVWSRSSVSRTASRISGDILICSRRRREWRRRVSAWACFSRHRRRRRHELGVGVKRWRLVCTRVVVDVLGIERRRALRRALALLLPDPVYASPRVDVVVDSPIRALSTVGEGTWHLLEARIQREVVPNGILHEMSVSQCIYIRDGCFCNGWEGRACGYETHLPSWRGISEIGELKYMSVVGA